MAFRLQFAAQEVFDFNQETKATRELYGSGAADTGAGAGTKTSTPEAR